MGSMLAPVRYRMVGQGAVMVVSGKGRPQPVQVAHDALTDIQSPPRSDASRLMQYMEVFTGIALRKIEAGEIAFDGRIWITGNDVRAWRCHRSEQNNSE